MSFRRYAPRLLQLSLLLAIPLFIYIPQAFGQTKLAILVGEFEPQGTTPKKELAQAQDALETALFKSALETQLKLDIVERRRLSRLFKELDYHNNLSSLINQDKVRKKLQGQKAEYVVLSTYSYHTEDEIRIDTRIVKLDGFDLVAKAYSIFDLNNKDRDPYTPLATDLTNQLLRFLGLERDEHTLLFVGLEINVTNADKAVGWGNVSVLKRDITSAIIGLVKTKSLLAKAKSKSLSWRKGGTDEEKFINDIPALAKKRHDIHLFMFGTLTVHNDSEPIVVMVQATIVDRKETIQAATDLRKSEFDRDFGVKQEVWIELLTELNSLLAVDP